MNIGKTVPKFEMINADRDELPVVISIPHSGVYLSKEMRANMADHVILPNMDWYLPELYSFLPEQGYTVMINHISRYVIDPNRSLHAAEESGDYRNNLIYSKTTFGREIYRTRLTDDEAASRIKEYYIPYHQALRNALSKKLRRFGTVYLIDLHSFGQDLPADIILGNHHGKTTSASFLKSVEQLFRQEGFQVQLNTPYSGGYITQFYGNEMDGCQALQIELRYRSYIDNIPFGEEEFPQVNKIIFQRAQAKMIRFFQNLKRSLRHHEV